MKVARRIMTQKKAYAKEMIAKHPAYHLMLINDMVAEKFEHKLNHATLARIHRNLRNNGQLGFKFADGRNLLPAQPGNPDPLVMMTRDPVAAKHAKRMIYVRPTPPPPPQGETIQGPVNLPPEVIAAAQLLIEAQRAHRVEELSVHSSGTVRAKVLAGIEGQVYLGGRRATDPKSEVDG